MKTPPSLFTITVCILFIRLSTVAQTTDAAVSASTNRVAFTLKNSLGYHRMFRVEGPGIAYGFTMNRNERVPTNWPVGSKLYFSEDGETVKGHILTVTADDAGKTLATGSREPERAPKPAGHRNEQEIAIRLRNNSIRFRKVALITYKPGESGNSTTIFTMAPYTVTSRNFVIGTRVYIADDRQVDVVMSGKPLTDKPFITVRKDDRGKLFNIFE